MEDVSQFDRSKPHRAKLEEVRAIKACRTAEVARTRLVETLFAGTCENFESYLKQVVAVATLQEFSGVAHCVPVNV